MKQAKVRKNKSQRAPLTAREPLAQEQPTGPLLDHRTTNLGLIRVESRGLLDVVYLNHNDVKVFTLRCRLAGASQIRISANFYAFDQQMWDDVLNAYLAWKRKQLPAFKLPNHSGRTKDGHRHPFRSFPRARRTHETEHESQAGEAPPGLELED